MADYKLKYKGAKIDELLTSVIRILDTLGIYTDRSNITLTPTETGVAISKDGTKISKAGWAIAEFTAVKGNEYLFNAGTIDGNVCLFSEKIIKQELRNIDYSYTYKDLFEGESLKVIDTAKATYNGVTHIYTFTYGTQWDAEQQKHLITDTTITDNDGNVVSSLPYQYETQEGTYQPMTILNADAELPKDGYCRLVSHFQNDSSLTVVVSYNTSNANLTMKVIRDGFTASICTQLSNLAKRISNTLDYATKLYKEKELIEKNQKVIELELFNNNTNNPVRLVYGQPAVLYANGTPSDSIIPYNWISLDEGGFEWRSTPLFEGQQYINVSVNSGGRYTAVRQSYDKTNANYNSLIWKNF